SDRIIDCPVKMMLSADDCGETVALMTNTMVRQVAVSASRPHFNRAPICVLLQYATPKTHRAIFGGDHSIAISLHAIPARNRPWCHPSILAAFEHAAYGAASVPNLSTDSKKSSSAHSRVGHRGGVWRPILPVTTRSRSI